LAFASSTAHEHEVGPGEHLSVEYLFYHAVARMPGQDPAGGTTMAATAAALVAEGQPIEAAWPYALDQVSPWVPPLITCTLHKVTLNLGKLSFDGVVSALDQGLPVVLGLIITDAFYRPGMDGAVMDITPDLRRGGHAVLAVGHGTDTKAQPMLLIRNSWGSGWGMGGYGWLSRLYVERQLHETAMLG
jgi:hypothetical protein